MRLIGAAHLGDDAALASMAVVAHAGSCWIVTPGFDTTNAAPSGTPYGFGSPVPSSVESTIRFAENHYDDLLRRLAD